MRGDIRIEEAIRTSYLARGLDGHQVRELVAMAEAREVGDGEVILEQFDISRDLLILVEGRAQVTTVVGDAIGIVQAGMPIGEVGFLDGKPRSVSVVSVGSSLVAVLPFERLRRLMDCDTGLEMLLLRNIASVLCARLRSANNNIAALQAIDESETMPRR